MDIIVTTPKTEIDNAAKEAKDALNGQVSHYFRKLRFFPKFLKKGDRVFYIENDRITGFAIVDGIAEHDGTECVTTGKQYTDGVYVWMWCKTWQWIKPITMRGFQGYRYRLGLSEENISTIKEPCRFDFEIAGDWKDPKPKGK